MNKEGEIKSDRTKKGDMEDKAIWRPRKQAWEESLKKVPAELNRAIITQEMLLAKAHSILVEQGRLSQPLSKTNEEQETEGQEFKVLGHLSDSIDKTTSDLIFQLIS